MRPPTGVNDFRQHLDGGADAVFHPPAMIGDDDPVDADVRGELCVLMGENALEHKLDLDGVAKPLDRIPGQVGDGGAADAAKSMPLKFGLRAK